MRNSLVILLGLLSAIMLLSIACGSDEADPNATATPAPPSTIPADQRAAEPTMAPTSVPATKAPAPVGSGVITLDIDVNGDALQFNISEMSADAGTEVVVNFTNSSGVNSHNWAVVESGTKDAVSVDGTTAGPTNNWLPVGDSRVIGNTPVLGPGESGTATFIAPVAGTYQFVCTFPGHNFTMFGDFIVN